MSEGQMSREAAFEVLLAATFARRDADGRLVVSNVQVAEAQLVLDQAQAAERAAVTETTASPVKSERRPSTGGDVDIDGAIASVFARDRSRARGPVRESGRTRRVIVQESGSGRILRVAK